MRNTEKDKYWREMIRKQGELRHFGSMAIRKSSKGVMHNKNRLILMLEVHFTDVFLQQELMETEME